MLIFHIFLLLISFSQNVKGSEDLTVNVYDVGQGHCVFTTQKDFAAIFDCGTSQKSTNRISTDSSRDAKQKITDFLEENKVKKLLVTISHPDQDHLSLIPDIIDSAIAQRVSVTLVLGGSIEKYFAEQFDTIGEKILEWINIPRNAVSVYSVSHVLDKTQIRELAIVASEIFENNGRLSRKEIYKKIRDAFRERYCGVENNTHNKTRGHIFNKKLSEIGITFPIPSSLEIRILSANAGQLANYNHNAEQQPTPIVNMDENTNSMVIKVIKKPSIRGREGFSFVSPGDATGETTNRLVFEATGNENIIKTDIALGGHHGSDTEESNNKVWIRYLQPEYIVFSAGTKFAHPRCSIVQNYIEAGSLGERGENHNFSCFRKTDEVEDLSDPFLISRATKQDMPKSSRKYTWKNIRHHIYNTHNSGNIRFILKTDGSDPEFYSSFSADPIPHYALPTDSSQKKTRPSTSPITGGGTRLNFSGLS